jgi:carboxymethylenebutenolidase
MSQTEIALATPDGAARAYTFAPEGAGPWPGVIFLMDAPAIRPALFDMSERIAAHGYFVILPDLFWRIGPYAPINVAEMFKDEAARRVVLGPMMASTDPEKAVRDVGACLDDLATQPRVKGAKVGVTGYCMGGGLALRAAGAFPDRVAAAAAFHGGRLATDAPDSPHLLAPKMKARVLVAGADEDAGFPPEQAEKLKAALDVAGVPNAVTIYKGARHGYAPADMPVYDREASERHFRELFGLLDETLKAG